YAASKNKYVSFLTNGLLIDDEWAAKIARSSRSICFSVNAATKTTHELVNRGSSWEKVLQNIHKVRKAKAIMASDLQIAGHMTIVPQNIQEIPLFIKSYHQLGFEYINFGYDLRMPAYLRHHPHLKEQTSLKIGRALVSLRNRSSVNDHALIKLGLIDYQDRAKKKAAPCKNRSTG
ncbi:MAG: radical SAM protein, partial [Candidatus Omnitrophica bacterium]|nr:radical SAM protein [Candidatus Omnitrophota bacterium]